MDTSLHAAPAPDPRRRRLVVGGALFGAGGGAALAGCATPRPDPTKPPPGLLPPQSIPPIGRVPPLATPPHFPAPEIVPAVAPSTAPLVGWIETVDVVSRTNGVTYPLKLYRAPAATDARAPWPVIYLLDAEWRLATLARIVEARGLALAIAGIANEATRNHDDVPENRCIPGGGGEATFLDVVRFELIPFVEARMRTDPARRALFGHSFGGAFALYAMLREAPGARHFGAYAALDPAGRCLGDAAYGWEADHAARHDRLDARLHFSYANAVNLPFAERLASRRYAGFELAVGAYAGGHDGMIPAAFGDALAFLFP